MKTFVYFLLYTVTSNCVSVFANVTENLLNRLREKDRDEKSFYPTSGNMEFPNVLQGQVL